MKWEHELRSNYTMKSFQKYMDMNLMVYLGNDNMGRPVALFKTYNFFIDKILDIKEYCKFFFYFFIIHLMSKTQGYIDDLIVLGDARNNTNRNFSFDVNKQVITTGIAKLPRHFFKLIIFGNNTLSFYIYQLLSPFLPSYAKQVIEMYKDDFD